MLAILCEKPSQARNFAKALGGMSGSYDGVSYEIVAARGHLYEFDDPQKQVPSSRVEYYKSWDLSKLPWDENEISWTYAPRGDVKDAIAAIKRTFSKADAWCIATDWDPSGEGQLLAWEIISQCGLRIPSGGVWRMKFSDEAPASIQKSFKNRFKLPAMENDPEYKKSYFRARWDWLSMQWTRSATLLGDGHSVLRNGRLKSAMVKIVGDRLEEIANYVKKPFFQNRFKDENGVVYVNPDEPTFDEKSQVPNTYHDSDVVCDSKAAKKTAPPRLIDLATLAARLAPKGLKSEGVLGIYQKMYENQVVSYPRTEDKCITEEQFKELLPKIDAICKVVGVDPSIVSHRSVRKTHVKDGMAHGANRPGPNVPNSLSELDAKFGKGAGMIYEILAKSYLAMLCEDYEYEQQKGHVKDYPAFVGSTNVPKKLGWKAVYDADDVDGDENAKGLGTTASPFVYEGANPKPQTPTMKWLMAQLAKYDIGTGATRTSTYADVTSTKTKYPLLKDSRGKISFADCGEMSYLLLPGTHIGDLQLTKRVQEQMEGIAKGSLNADACLHEIQQLVRDDISVMEDNAKEMHKRLGITTASAAPAEVAEGFWNGAPVKFKRTFSGHRFTDDEVVRLLSGEEIVVTDFVSAKSGATFAAKGKLERQSYKGRTYVGFKVSDFVNADGSAREKVDASEYHEGTWKRKKVRFKRNFRGHEVTDAEAKELLAGKEIVIGGLKAKSGKEYSVKCKLANLSYNGHKYVGIDVVGFA